MAHTLLVTGAPQAEVVRLLREVLTDRGAILDEQTRARTVFEGLEVPGGFQRGGYVGAYQPVGEKGVEVLVEAYATGPRRAFWALAVVELLAVLVFVLASPPSVVWFAGALVMWPLIAAVGLLYYLTFAASSQVEAALHQDMLARLREAGLPVLDEEGQLERTIRQRLEGEAKQREVAARAAAEPRRGLGLRRGPEEGGGEEEAPRKRGLFRSRGA